MLVLVQVTPASKGALGEAGAESEPLHTVSAPPSQPPAPLLSAATSTTLALYWEAPAANGDAIAHYDVERRAQPDSGGAAAAWQPAGPSCLPPLSLVM